MEDKNVELTEQGANPSLAHPKASPFQDTVLYATITERVKFAIAAMFQKKTTVKDAKDVKEVKKSKVQTEGLSTIMELIGKDITDWEDQQSMIDVDNMKNAQLSKEGIDVSKLNSALQKK